MTNTSISPQVKRMQDARVAKFKERKESGVQVAHYTNPIQRWENSAKTSRALAIKANCAACVGCTLKDIEPGFKETIRQCAITSCPLYGFRPYAKPARGLNE